MKDDHSLNNNRVEESTYSKATTSSLGLQSLEMPIGAMEMTSNINYVNSFSEPIYSNIIDTTNKPLIDRLKIECDYTWHPITNKATKYIDELIDNYDTRNKFHSKLQLPFVLPNKTTYLLVNTMKYIGLINLLTNCFNGKIYAMYYNNGLQYYFIFETYLRYIKHELEAQVSISDAE
ncbi:hypothetical protein C2G38_2284865 [Gigaspora rosea]|uniref:Uncharacterized protein n=1 Tax=Gigaspora rosea TaxID=44941 RepID=A0A397UAQ4_9GLOM|nr:hypothetical protein C2G38_2284865 [Gigaspora rosea]